MKNVTQPRDIKKAVMERRLGRAGKAGHSGLVDKLISLKFSDVIQYLRAVLRYIWVNFTKMFGNKSKLLELDVDKLFEERSIDEIIEIEKILDAEIEKKP
ncbi:hypothetical protein NQ317_007179 [Molorchus minor]|uniref:Uncharacterized protein n=1 Tax=Molorchus minor TaxID=1323400 RepID=A0ABQ9J0V0_9CUCU|nr:hypothetical protein NQ317_007179 [Molorchus minor]